MANSPNLNSAYKIFKNFSMIACLKDFQEFADILIHEFDQSETDR